MSLIKSQFKKAHIECSITDLSPSLAKILSKPILVLEPPATIIADTFLFRSCFTQDRRSITPEESFVIDSSLCSALE